MAIDNTTQRPAAVSRPGIDPRLLYGLIALLVLGAVYLLYATGSLPNRLTRNGWHFARPFSY